MKGLLKRVLARRGYGVQARPLALLKAPDSILRLDLSFVIAHLLLRQSDPFIVQVGAYDGKANDPWEEYIRRFDLAGLLVEPQPGPAARLTARYADRPRVRVCRAAVADTDGARDLYRIDPAVGDPPWAEQIASFRKDVLLGHAHAVPGLAERVVAETVPCLRFDTLFARHAVTRVDILQVDTEGYDYEVLKLFPFDHHRPRLVRYEHAHLSSADREACILMLAAHGYQLHVPDLSAMDTIAYRAGDGLDHVPPTNLSNDSLTPSQTVVALLGRRAT